MHYDIFKSIPHQRVVSKHGATEEIFDIYPCGLFQSPNHHENVELVALQPQAQYLPHFHQQSAAVLYIISGSGILQLAHQHIKYQPGMRITIPAGFVHGFKTSTRTLFLSIQSPPIIHPENGEIDLHYVDRNSDEATA